MKGLALQIFIQGRCTGLKSYPAKLTGLFHYIWIRYDILIRTMDMHYPYYIDTLSLATVCVVLDHEYDSR